VSLNARSIERRDGQRGFTTVEFALTLPLLLTLLFGSIDGGLLVISRCMVSYAAVTATRTASLRSTTMTLSSVKTAATDAIPFLTISTSNIHVYVNDVEVTTDVAFKARTAGTGNTVKVTVAYAYVPVTPGFTKLGSKTLTGTSKAVTE
jgi:Flp pilus assembly protein TadG